MEAMETYVPLVSAPLEDCRAIIRAIQQRVGPAPDGAMLMLKRMLGSAENLYTVICCYDIEKEEAVDYAAQCQFAGY